MQNENADTTIGPTSPGTRRGALAAMLAGSALGLTAIGGVGSKRVDAKGKKNRKRRNGKASSGGDNRGNGSLPSVRYVIEDNIADDNSLFIGIAQCPAGYLPIGGGIVDAFPNAVLLASNPNPDEREWAIEVDGAVDGDTMTVVAVCLQATDDTPEEEKKNRSRGKKARGKKKR